MSYSLDVNILLYASDQQSPFHERAVRFLEECVRRQEPLYLAWPTLSGYLRMVTHAKIFAKPLPHEEAVQNIAALLSLPQVHAISEQDGFWEVYREVTRELVVRGKLVPDAHLAALLLQNGIRILYTNDSDFDQFPFLEVRNPFTEQSF